jgi:hypothetical protein
VIREETVLCEVTATHLFNSDPQGTATLLINSTSLASDTATIPSTVPHLRVALQRVISINFIAKIALRGPAFSSKNSACLGPTFATKILHFQDQNFRSKISTISH